MPEITFAIGDIHGCHDLLQILLRDIERYAAGQPYTLVFLGDLIDRGSDSAAVVQTVRDLQARGAFLYAIGFTGNLVVPKSIDDGPVTPALGAVAINVALLTLFACQHSVMARPAFKRWWTRIVPPSIERSVFVLLASLALLLLFWQWRPLEAVVWTASTPALAISLYALFWIGWSIVLASTFMISHFELFGLRQVVAQWMGQALPSMPFRTPYLYRYVRHPIYLGFIIAFWATPTMTVGHLLFSSVTTLYILIGIYLAGC